MSNWNLYGGGGYTVLGAIEGSSSGTFVSTSAAFTKTGWAQLSASMPRDCEGFFLCATTFYNTDIFTVDVGIGSAGSEVAIASDITYLGSMTMMQWMPLHISAGQRVSVRLSGDDIVGVLFTLTGVPSNPARNYGGCRLQSNINTANLLGTIIDPGAVAFTKGAWVTAISSTNFTVSALGVHVSCGANGGRSGGTINTLGLTDIGIGSAGNEQAILLDWQSASQNGASCPPGGISWFPADIPAGSRIAVRNMADGTVSPDRTVDVRVYVAG